MTPLGWFLLGTGMGIALSIVGMLIAEFIADLDKLERSYVRNPTRRDKHDA